MQVFKIEMVSHIKEGYKNKISGPERWLHGLNTYMQGMQETRVQFLVPLSPSTKFKEALEYEHMCPPNKISEK